MFLAKAFNYFNNSSLMISRETNRDWFFYLKWHFIAIRVTDVWIQEYEMERCAHAEWLRRQSGALAVLFAELRCFIRRLIIRHIKWNDVLSLRNYWLPASLYAVARASLNRSTRTFPTTDGARKIHLNDARPDAQL